MYTILDVVADNTYAPAMARMLLLLGVTIIIGSFAFSQTETFDHPDLFAKYYKEMQAFGIPMEGSAAERHISEYVADLARRHGFATQWQAITSEHDYHSFASNLSITIPGNQTKAIALLFPLDSPLRLAPGTSHDPFLGPALVCSLMDHLSGQEIPQTIVIGLLGAEDGLTAGLGARNFIEKTPRASLALVVCFDYSATAKTWDIVHGGSGKVSPSWLFGLGLSVLQKAGISISINTIESQLYRLSVNSEGMLTPFLKAGYPAIQLRPHLKIPALGIQESAQALRKAILDLVMNHSAEITNPMNRTSWDSNYLFLDLAGYHIISEKSIAIIFLVSMVAYLILIFIKRKDRHRYVNSLARNFPKFLAILAASFLVFVIDTWLGLLFLPAYSVAPAYQEGMVIFFLGKLLCGLALIMGLTGLFRHKIPSQSSFHAAAAFFVSLTALIIVATISITVSVYLMAVTFFISLGNLSRSRILKIVLFAISAMCIMQPLFEALRLYPGLSLDQLLLRSVFPGAVLMTLIGVPFVFLWLRVQLFIPVHFKLLRRVELIILTGLFFGGLVIMLGTMISIRLNVDGMADLRVLREIDHQTGEDTLLATGASLLPPGAFKYAGQAIRLPFATESLRTKIIAPKPNEPIFSQTTRKFLGRKSLQLLISSQTGISKLDLRFTADHELIVLSLNFPYRYLDARNIEIQIGKNPPPLINLELTIPLDVTGTMQVIADLPDHLEFQPDTGIAHRIESVVRYISRISWD